MATRRDGKAIHYRLASNETRAFLVLLHDLFCAEGKAQRSSPPKHAPASDRIAL